jgi:hypothetical protein
VTGLVSRKKYRDTERLESLNNLSYLLKEQERTYSKLKQGLLDIKPIIPDENFLVLSEKTGYTRTLKKAGTALVLASPIPIVSDLLGVGLLGAGLITEYRKRRRIRRLLEEYTYFLSSDVLL